MSTSKSVKQMAKYIDIEKEIAEMQQVVALYKDNKTFEAEITSFAFQAIIDKLKQISAADVTLVVHAHWINYNGGPVELDSNGSPKDSCWCSHCHEWLVTSDEYTSVNRYCGRYCPNCGAKMDGDK